MLNFFKKKSKFKRVITPSVIQMEVTECGAACLSMILGYYRYFSPLEEVRSACAVSRDGSNAANILKAAEYYKLDSKGYKKDVEELHELEPPFIVFWEFNHFVVVDGFSEKGVYLNDPGRGITFVSNKEFSEKYTGIVLTFTPQKDFIKRGNPPSVFDGLKKRLSGIQKPLLYLGIAQFCLLVPTIATAIFARIFVDQLLTVAHGNLVGGLVFSMFAALILNAILTWFQGVGLYKLNGFLSIKLSADFIKYIFKLPLFFYQQRFSGDLAWRVQLNNIASNLLTGKLARLSFNILLITAYVIVMFLFNPWIAATVIGISCLNLGVLLKLQRTRTIAMSCLMQKYLHMVGFSISMLQNIETVKSLSLESDYFSRWAGHNAEWLMANQEFNKKTIFLNVLSPFFYSAANIATIILGIYFIMHEKLSLGAFLGIQIIVQQFLQPFADFVMLGQNLQETKAYINKLDDCLENKLDKNFELEHNLTPAQIKKAEPKLKGFLELKNINFGYSVSQPAFIQNFNLKLNPGEIIAIVGSSGCGKTTIAKIALSLYHPWKGEVRYDDKLRKDIFEHVLHNSIGFVDQELFFFSASIKDNITLWNTIIPESDMIQAAKDACIHEEILKRKAGYDHIIEEGGLDLSGGERQRLEIARSLVLNPTLMILDEATSSLDSVTEEKILQNIKRRGSSCLIIAHRLSTIKNADLIIVMSNGKIVQQGTHKELHNKGLYQELTKTRGE